MPCAVGIAVLWLALSLSSAHVDVLNMCPRWVVRQLVLRVDHLGNGDERDDGEDEAVGHHDLRCCFSGIACVNELECARPAFYLPLWVGYGPREERFGERAQAGARPPFGSAAKSAAESCAARGGSQIRLRTRVSRLVLQLVATVEMPIVPSIL